MGCRWLLVACLGLAVTGCGGRTPKVVLYCGQDREFAEDILKDFTKKTGIQVEIRGDTEADKSVSLFEAIVREKAHPRCDVFWNGEILNTLRLRERALLRPYRSPAGEPYPGAAKGADHIWHGFASRVRVLIVHTRVTKPPSTTEELAKPEWKGRIAMAKPMFGTTATHAACLFQVLGKEKAEAYYTALKENAAILPGNKDVAVAVGQGRYDVGWTDTDDAIGEIDKGSPVQIIFPDQEGIGSLFIPNTVAIIAGGPNSLSAEKLVDYLLSPEIETRLAQGPSKQIPMNPGVQIEMPASFVNNAKMMKVDFAQAAQDWERVQTFLRNLFARS